MNKVNKINNVFAILCEIDNQNKFKINYKMIFKR